MSIKDQLVADMKTAMKAGNKQELEVIRYVIAKVKNVEIDQGELTDTQVQQLISKQIKEMKEVLADYHRAGRTDLAASDEAKMQILQKYLPAPLTETELDEIIATVMEANPAAALGQVIGMVNQRTAGRADGKVIADKVKARLA